MRKTSTITCRTKYEIHNERRQALEKAIKLERELITMLDEEEGTNEMKEGHVAVKFKDEFECTGQEEIVFKCLKLFFEFKNQPTDQELEFNSEKCQ